MKQSRNPGFLALLALAFCVSASVADEGVWEVEVKGGENELSVSGRSITAAYFSGDAGRVPLTVGFSEDASKVTLLVPEGREGKVTVEGAEKTQQFMEGRIVLSAVDAEVKGVKAKLESDPGNHRIGYWSEIGDAVYWNYKATRPGMYDVELSYSLVGEGSEVEVVVGEEVLRGRLEASGSWYRYTTASLGRVYVEKPGELGVRVRGVSMGGGALMNLKAITLLPASEGKPVEADSEGVLVLDSSAVTVYGTLLQYERKAEKLCVGYWTKPEEWAAWTFPVGEPGKFKVEITQGCGRGHGGSEVRLVVGGESIEFVVEDTGGFQNWKVRELGEVSFEEAGEYRLELRPKTKKGVAVMDVRRVRLVPVS